MRHGLWVYLCWVGLVGAADLKHWDNKPHAHGLVELHGVLDGSVLILELESPAVNFLGFEHLARTAEEQARVAQVANILHQPEQWLGVSPAAQCRLTQHQVAGILLRGIAEGKEQAEEDAHSDLSAQYRFDCLHPEQLRQLDFSGLWPLFPAIEQVQAQFIGPSGQQAHRLTAQQPQWVFP